MADKIDTLHPKGDLTTNLYPNIKTESIPDRGVTRSKLALQSVGSAQLEQNSVTTDKFADGTISTAKIADKAVTSAKLADNQSIAGTLDVEGKFTAGGDAEVDGTLQVNGRDSIALKDASADKLALSSELASDYNALDAKIEANSALIETKQDKGNYATSTALTEGLAKKQDALVSGTNIKTINGEKLLGSGNLSILGGVRALPLYLSITAKSDCTFDLYVYKSDGTYVESTEKCSDYAKGKYTASGVAFLIVPVGGVITWFLQRNLGNEEGVVLSNGQIDYSITKGSATSVSIVPLYLTSDTEYIQVEMDITAS